MAITTTFISENAPADFTQAIHDIASAFSDVASVAVVLLTANPAKNSYQAIVFNE